MPGNIITINNAKELSWYIGDSQMEPLIIYLDEIGFREYVEEIPKRSFFLVKFFHNVIDRFSVNRNFSEESSI